MQKSVIGCVVSTAVFPLEAFADIRSSLLESGRAAGPTWRRAAVCVAPRLCWLLVVMLTSAPLVASTARFMVPEERVQQAEDVFVASVIDSEAYWSEGLPRVIHTVYRLQIERGVIGAGGTGESVTMRVWGGTIGNETQLMAGIRRPQVGQRYVFMLAPGWREATSNPIVGLDQGLFEIVTDQSTGRERILNFKGQTLESVLSDGSANPMSLSDFELWIRAARARAIERGTNASVTRPAADTPVTVNGVSLRETSASDPAIDQSNFVVQCRVRSYMLWNQFTYTNGWYLVDVHEMSKWNFYSEAFRILQDPTDNRYWGNGVSETYNAMTDAQRQAVFGAGPWGTTEHAVTFSRCIDGYVVEADITFNAAINWTLDDEQVFANNVPANTWPLRRTMLHELGHAAGLDHEFNQLSVMNDVNLPKEFRAYGLPFMHDAEGIRNTTPGNQARTDVGVYLFRSTGFQSWTHALFPPAVAAGETLRISNFAVENVGTNPVVNPVLNWYLTPDRWYTSNGWFAYLGQTVLNATLNRFAALPSAQADVTVQVPLNADGGSYFLSALVTSPAWGTASAPTQGTFPFAHNAGFSQRRIRVLPSPYYVDTPWLVGGQPGQATVGLAGRTDQFGLTIYLQSSDPNTVSVPFSIFAPPGVTEATFPVTSAAVQMPKDVTITARVESISATGLSRIFPGGITITSPEAGNRWVIGSTQTIRWNHGLGAGTVVQVSLSRDGGVTYSQVIGNVTNGATSGELAWSVLGPATESANVRIRFGNVSIVDVPFTIATSSPTAVNDSFTVPSQGSLFIPAPGVLVNDNPDSGTNIIVQQVVGVSHGTLTLAANGAFTYIPAIDFRGADTFSYRFTTALGTSNTASVTVTVGASVSRDDLAIDFGAAGLWARYHNTAWARLHTANPAAMATGDIDNDGCADLIATFPGSGVWVLLNNTSWFRLHTADASSITTGDMDGNGRDEVLLVFPGSGVWVYANGSGFFQLHTLNPDRVITGDLDGNGKADVILNFPGQGIWIRLNNATWSRLHSLNGTAFTVGDFDGTGKADLLVNFPGVGLWLWSNNSSWSLLHPANATVMAAGDIDGGGKTDAIISFPGAGVWAWKNSTSWQRLHTADANMIVAADVDASGRDDVIISFPVSGVWAWMNHASWQFLHTQNPEGIVVGNLDGN